MRAPLAGHPRYRRLFGQDDCLVVENGPGLQHGYGFGADGSGAFAYFDTEAELGYLIEAIEPATG